jgi:cytochrome c oxidase subunit 2
MRTLNSIPRARALIALSAVLWSVGCDWEIHPPGATASGEEIFQLCVQCHGQNAEGNKQFNAPSIAGLPQWYVELQLPKFRTGTRGTHPADITGMQMRPMAISFHNDADLKTIAAYVANLPRPVAKPMLEGDAVNGQTLYTPCTACHGPDAAGNEQLKAPPLKHANDWYLLAQLEKFKSGARGANPADIEGAQMRPMAATLADEQAMRDVVAHIMTLK